MSAPGTVHVVVPNGIDDPCRPSGGNVYDRRLCDGLRTAGWTVHEVPVAGSWPRPDRAALAGLAAALAGVPAGRVALVDGLVASAVPEVLVPQSRRLRTVVLLHMPLGERVHVREAKQREQAVLASAAAVVVTSRWARRWVLDAYRLDPGRVHVATPGVDTAPLSPGTEHGGHLLCVAALTPDKGHDVLLAALAQVRDLPWRCECVGGAVAPGFADRLARQARDAGLDDRVSFGGPRTGAALDASYAAADALLLATRADSYGMVVLEALARGIPVLATEAGGLPEALGTAPDGTRPGLLVPVDDAPGLAGSLRRWLGDPALRASLRTAARQRRTTLTSWREPTDRVAGILAEVAR